MPLICNIDAKGKRVRFLLGAATVLAAAVLAVLWAWPRGGWWPWTAVGLLAVYGGFAIFEARAGWCVMRAMGFKTRL